MEDVSAYEGGSSTYKDGSSAYGGASAYAYNGSVAYAYKDGSYEDGASAYAYEDGSSAAYKDASAYEDGSVAYAYKDGSYEDGSSAYAYKDVCAYAYKDGSYEDGSSAYAYKDASAYEKGSVAYAKTYGEGSACKSMKVKPLPCGHHAISKAMKAKQVANKDCLQLKKEEQEEQGNQNLITCAKKWVRSLKPWHVLGLSVAYKCVFFLGGGGGYLGLWVFAMVAELLDSIHAQEQSKKEKVVKKNQVANLQKMSSKDP